MIATVKQVSIMPTETTRLTRDREKGGERGYGGGGRGRLYTYRLTVTIRMTLALQTGSDESHFNIQLIVNDKITNSVHKPNIFEEKGELKRNRAEVT